MFLAPLQPVPCPPPEACSWAHQKRVQESAPFFRQLTAGFYSDHPQRLAEHLFFLNPPKDINRFTSEHDGPVGTPPFPKICVPSNQESLYLKERVTLAR